MINNIKRDIIVLLGGLIIPYMITKNLEIRELDTSLYVIYTLILSGMMSCIHVIIYEEFKRENDTTYCIAAIMFNFQSINMMLYLVLNRMSYSGFIRYNMMLFECNLFELFCMTLFRKYVGKKMNKDRVATIMAIYFFLAIVISKLIYYYFGMEMYQIAMIIVASILIISSTWKIKVTKEYGWVLSEKGTYYLNVYYIVSVIYDVLGIYQSINQNTLEITHIHWILMYIRCISMYFIGVSLYYNYLQRNWEQLVEAVRSTKEKIYSNSQDRDAIINLSHELKTPINVIQSATQILRFDIQLDKSGLKELKNIRYQCNEAMKLITSMIDINKLKGGYLKPKFELYNIIEGVENIVDAFALEYNDVNLIFNTNEEEVNVKVDITLIQRAGMYIIGTMLNQGRKDIYVDMEYIAINKQISIRIYAEDICNFIEEHNKDVAKCKNEGVGDLLALEFIRHILGLHEAQIIHESSGCLRVDFTSKVDLQAEPIFLENNIDYLREEIRNSYLII